MNLKSDNYDPSRVVEDLILAARGAVGSPVWRMAGPEIEDFIRYQVANSLRDAFSKAEALYINESFKQAQQNSGNLLKAILTGFDVAQRKEEEKK